MYYNVLMAKKAKPPRSIRLDDFMEQELLEVAKAEDRSVNYLIQKAIESFLEEYNQKRRKRKT